MAVQSGKRAIKVETSKLFGVAVTGAKVGASKPVTVGASKPRA